MLPFNSASFFSTWQVQAHLPGQAAPDPLGSLVPSGSKITPDQAGSFIPAWSKTLPRRLVLFPAGREFRMLPLNRASFFSTWQVHAHLPGQAT